MENKSSNTWKRIKSLSGSRKDPFDDEDLLSNLGVDRATLDRLEEETVKSAMEEVKPKIRYQNTSTNPNLTYKYIDDSGMDLRANLDTPVTIKSLDRVLIPTGTVDRGYSGEIKIILMNLSKENFTVNHGDRIAQAVVSPVISGRWCNLIKVDNLSVTNRGSGGFGSTGIE